MHTNIQNLKEILSAHDKAIILYIGDLDPSGTDMDRHLKNVLEFFGMADKVEFKRLALLPEQVEQHNLPPKPEDVETLAKVERDPRKKNYELDYIVEVDAFLALAPEQFKELIRTTIRKYHDEEIAREVREENSNIIDGSSNILEEAKKKAKDVLLSQIRGGDM